MFASSSSFMLLVVSRQHQNVTVIRISQLISRKCAEQVLHSAFPLQYSFSDCLVIDIVPFVSDNILKIFEIRKWFTPSFIASSGVTPGTFELLCVRAVSGPVTAAFFSELSNVLD